jgi:hypothetical protein
MLVIGAPNSSKKLIIPDTFTFELLTNLGIFPKFPTTKLDQVSEVPIQKQDNISVYIKQYIQQQNQPIINDKDIGNLEKQILESFNERKIPHQINSQYCIGNINLHYKGGWSTQPIIIINKEAYTNKIGEKKIIQWSEENIKWYKTRQISF